MPDYGLIWLAGMGFACLALTLTKRPSTLEQGVLLAMIGVLWFITVPLMMVSVRVRAFLLERIGGA